MLPLLPCRLDSRKSDAFTSAFGGKKNGYITNKAYLTVEIGFVIHFSLIDQSAEDASNTHGPGCTVKYTYSPSADRSSTPSTSPVATPFA